MSKPLPAQNRDAALASLMARMRQPYELQRLALLLLILGQMRARAGYTTVDPAPPRPAAPAAPVPKTSGFHIKTPRSRFL